MTVLKCQSPDLILFQTALDKVVSASALRLSQMMLHDGLEPMNILAV